MLVTGLTNCGSVDWGCGILLLRWGWEDRTGGEAEKLVGVELTAIGCVCPTDVDITVGRYGFWIPSSGIPVGSCAGLKGWGVKVFCWFGSCCKGGCDNAVVGRGTLVVGRGTFEGGLLTKRGAWMPVLAEIFILAKDACSPEMLKTWHQLNKHNEKCLHFNMGFETILMNLYKPETTEHHSSYYNTMQVSISTGENSYLKKEMYKWCYIELKKKKKTAQ